MDAFAVELYILLCEIIICSKLIVKVAIWETDIVKGDCCIILTTTLFSILQNGRGIHALRRFLHELNSNSENQTIACVTLRTQIEKVRKPVTNPTWAI